MAQSNELDDLLNDPALLANLAELEEGSLPVQTAVPALREPALPNYPITEEQAERRRCTVGTADVPVSDFRTNEILDTICAAPWVTQEDTPVLRRNVRMMLEGMAPRDEIEVQLVQHIIAAHFATMASFRKAWQASLSIEVRDIYLKSAIRTSDLHAKLTAALDKHRVGGKQEMKVTYVHVDQGAQAIVGDVEMKRCSKRGAKPRGGAHAPITSGPERNNAGRAAKAKASDRGACS